MARHAALKSRLKQRLLPEGAAPWTIRAGLLSGLRIDLDLQHRTQLWLGLQERELLKWVRSLSKDIRTAIDVGANDGMYTLYFLAKTRAVNTIAFEPSVEDLLQLRRNLALNQLADDLRLQIVPQFVGAVAGPNATTLDAFSDSLLSPCLIKVDIDGGEVDLLRGARNTLSLSDVRWIIEVHSKELEEQCIDILRHANYRVQVVPNAWWRAFLPELRPIGHNRWLVATSKRRP
jgi:hypothetical protein